MKKSLKFFAVLAAVSVSAVSMSFAIEAKITSVTGKVQVQSQGSSEWVDVAKNDILKTGDIISTGFNSNATIVMGTSVLTVAPLSRMSIEQLTQKDVGGDKNLTKTTIYIDSGKASFKVNSSARNLNDFKIHSPASTASVRGTAGDVYADGDIYATEGLIGADEGVRDRKSIKKSSNFVPSGKPYNGFTSTREVGGSGDSIPVFAGQKMVYDDVFRVWSQPVAQKADDVKSLPGEEVSLADKQVITGAVIPFGFTNIATEKQVSDAVAADGSDCSDDTAISLGIE